MNNQLTIALSRDCIESFRRHLAGMGYKVGSDDDRVLCLYHKIAIRTLINPKPRTVRVSPQFTCPEEYEPGLSNLRRAIEKGEDLSPFMSKRVKQARARDHLLDYWRIHHFHLGSRIEKDGFVGRTQHILMALWDSQYVYFIRIEDHSKGNDPWYKKKLLTILHENWPELIAYARIPGATDVHHEHCDEEIRQLRKAGLSTSHRIGDAVYVDPGIGVLGNGAHIDDLRFADRILLAVENIEEEVLRDWESIREHAALQGFFMDANATLSLRDIFLLEIHQIGAPICSNVLYIDIMEAKTGYWFRRYTPPRRLPFPAREGAGG